MNDNIEYKSYLSTINQDNKLLQKLFYLYGKKDFEQLKKLFDELEKKCENLLNNMNINLSTLDNKSNGYSPNGEILLTLERIKRYLEEENKEKIDLELLRARSAIAKQFEKESTLSDELENIAVMASMYLYSIDAFYVKMIEDYREVPLQFLQITNTTIEYLLLFREHIYEGIKILNEQKEKSIFLFNKVTSQI